MFDPSDLTQIQYELSMSIGSSLDMERMLKDALSTFLRRLGGNAIGVHFRPGWDDRYTDQPYTVPRSAVRFPLYSEAAGHLPTDRDGWQRLARTLPLSEGSAEAGFFHLLYLPGVGVLILTRQNAPLEAVIVASLQPLLARLANACLACRQNQALSDAHLETVRINQELTRTQEELHELAGRRQAILDAIPDWMFTLSRDGVILDYKVTEATPVSRMVAGLVAVGISIDEVLPPSLSALTRSTIQKALTSRERQSFETYIDFQDEITYLEARLVVSGPDEVLAIVQDITERKQLAEQLEVLARFPSENPNPVMRVAPDGRILFANQKSQPILDEWQKEGEGRVPVHWLDLCAEVLEMGVETSLEEPVGDRFYLFTVAPIVEGGYVNLYARDITERYYAEEILAQERNLLRTLIDNLPDQIYVKDRESNFLLNNPAVLQVLGVDSDDELLGRNDFDFHSIPLAAEYYADEQYMMRTGRQMVNKEEMLIDADGVEHWLSTTKVPLYDSRGEVIGLVGINRDITESKRASDSLRQIAEQNQLLAQAVEAASDGVVIVDATQPDNPVIYANPAFTRITGYPVEEVIGRNCRFLQGPETDPGELEKLRRAIREKRSVAVTLLNYRKDGRPFWNELAISPVFSPEGELTHFVGIQTDNSERRRMARTLQAVLDTVGEGIISADGSGQIVMVNPEIERIFGYKADELLGQPLTLLMPENYRDAHRAGMVRFLDTGVPHVLGKRLELEGVRKDGQIFPLELYISQTQFADNQLFTASMRDITQRKEYDRMRDDFVSTVTHELRTPLASVMGWTETLLSQKPGPLTDLQKRFLGIVYDSSQRLNRLIEEILTVSRIQRGTLQLHKQEFSPRESVAGVREMLRALAAPKNIEVEYREEWPADQRLMGDANRIEQVLTNLIGNAIKFSPEGASVTVESLEEAGQWRVAVQDRGIGIPAGEIPHLFERFYRASNAGKAQIQGTGLGLYVCKAIVEGHGGEIGLESVVGEGTTVWFTLPA